MLLAPVVMIIDSHMTLLVPGFEQKKDSTAYSAALFF
jgi:hypothetical protein